MNAAVKRNRTFAWFAACALLGLSTFGLVAKGAAKGDGPPFPPVLPKGEHVITDTSPEFLKPPAGLLKDVAIAKEPPTVDFLFYPGQDYPGNPWSNWGDSLAVNGKYYASIGNHLAPAGNAFVYEYDPAAKTFRQLLDVRKVLNLPDGHYTPGKIHSRLDIGSDGRLYCATHRGSTNATTDANHYKGDWILAIDPQNGKSEVIAQGPAGKHCIPNSVLDPKRLIFYGGTAPGTGPAEEDIHFFAYDIRNKKLLYDGADGPARYMMFARSTGRVYYTPGLKDEPLMRFDPAAGSAPVKIDGAIGIRSATQETPDGFIYTVSQGHDKEDSILYSFNTKTEKVEKLGSIAVGSQTYVASIDADPTGRYLYYVPGAHGGASADGSPLVQFDTKLKRRKVICFLHPYYQEKFGATLKGTYSSAVSENGSEVYITWNVSRGSKAWDSCALTVVHLPASERVP